MLTIDIPYFSTATNTFECSYDTQLTDNDVRSTLTYISNGYCGTLPGYCDIINYIPIKPPIYFLLPFIPIPSFTIY